MTFGLRGVLQSRPVWLLQRQLRKIWVRVAGFAVFALISVAAAQPLGRLVPQGVADRLGAEAVGEVLSILASSMLAVTTFSLSVAVSAFATAASTATPRATALLQEDNTTQNVLATFLGAFLFSLVGVVALKANYYTEGGKIVLFAATLLVILLVVVALIRWISHLTEFGRMRDTLARVETAAEDAIARRVKSPWLGGCPMNEAGAPKDAVAVMARRVGHVQHIDMEALSEAADSADATVWVAALPGTFVHTGCPLALVKKRADEGMDETAFCDAFTIGSERDFEQDPSFGLVVLSEIASRALSPAVNDPGTAIDVLERQARVLSGWTQDVSLKPDYPNIKVPGLSSDELFEAAFAAIARDGAGQVEVMHRLQTVLRALAVAAPESFGELAHDWAARVIDRAQAAGLSDREMQQLKDAARGEG